jgi:hypothetical protein
MKQNSKPIYRAFYTRVEGEGENLYPILFRLAHRSDGEAWETPVVTHREYITEVEELFSWKEYSVSELFCEDTPIVPSIVRPSLISNASCNALACELMEAGLLEDPVIFKYDPYPSVGSWHSYYFEPEEEQQVEDGPESRQVFRAFYTRVQDEGDGLYPILLHLIFLQGKPHWRSAVSSEPYIKRLVESNIYNASDVEELFNDKTPIFPNIIRKKRTFFYLQDDAEFTDMLIEAGALESVDRFKFDPSGKGRNNFFLKVEKQEQQKEVAPMKDLQTESADEQEEDSNLLHMLYKDYREMMEAVFPYFLERRRFLGLPEDEVFEACSSRVQIRLEQERFLFKYDDGSWKELYHILLSDFNSVSDMLFLANQTEKNLKSIKKQMDSESAKMKSQYQETSEVIAKLKRLDFE